MLRQYNRTMIEVYSDLTYEAAEIVLERMVLALRLVQLTCIGCAEDA